MVVVVVAIVVMVVLQIFAMAGHCYDLSSGGS